MVSMRGCFTDGRPDMDVRAPKFDLAHIRFTQGPCANIVFKVSLSSHKETLGFLCRWLLLVSAAGGVLLCVYVIASSSASRPVTVPAMVFDDLLYAPGANARLTGAITHSIKPAGVSVMIRLDDEPVQNSPIRIAKISHRMSAPLQPGRYEVSIVGAPHSPLAYQASSIDLVVVGLHQPLFLIDATLLQEHQAWHALYPWRQSKTHVAYLHPGPARDLQTFRASLRQAGDDAPVIGQLHPGLKYENLINAIANNIHINRRIAPTTIVTPDAKVASVAQRRGLKVVLLWPEKVPQPRGLNATIITSLDQLISHQNQ